MKIDLPEETWKGIHDMASLGEVEQGGMVEDVEALRQALFAAGVAELSWGWNGRTIKAPE